MQAAEAAAAAEAALNGKEEPGAEGSAADSEEKVPNGGLDANSGVKADADLAAAAGNDSDSDVVCMDEGEGDTAHSGYSGFYRASRETGRANVLLALQVPCLSHSSNLQE